MEHVPSPALSGADPAFALAKARDAARVGVNRRSPDFEQE
jgi:hypothetical protein